MTDRSSNPVLSAKEFTRPGDPDSAPGLQQAIDTAIRRGCSEIRLEAGVYTLRTAEEINTHGMNHDAGSPRGTGFPSRKACHLHLRGTKGLKICGEVDDQGKPQTVLSGFNDDEEHGFLPSILWCEQNTGLTIENLAFTRTLPYAFTGEVTATSFEGVTLRLLSEPRDLTGRDPYCMNRFDPDGRTLVGESLSYGNGSKVQFEAKGDSWFLPSAAIAAKVTVGDRLSWHQGAQTDFQVYFGQCDDLTLSNLETRNTNGFAILAEQCHTLTARDIRFQPDGERLFTGPRDAWKLFKCSGSIEIQRMHVQGVRMDGQNVHSNWLRIEEIEGNLLSAYCPYTPGRIPVGTRVSFYQGNQRHSLELADAHLGDPMEKGYRYHLTLAAPPPSFLKTGDLLALNCWEPEQYSCTDSTFLNIAGAGHLLRVSEVTLQRNTYRNMMNAGVLLGAELPTHMEGGHCENVRIEDCLFDNCGFHERYGAGGCIAVKSDGFSGPLNRHLHIKNNAFRHSTVAVDLKDAAEVHITGNRYEQVQTRLQVEQATCTEIVSVDN